MNAVMRKPKLLKTISISVKQGVSEEKESSFVEWKQAFNCFVVLTFNPFTSTLKVCHLVYFSGAERLFLA